MTSDPYPEHTKLRSIKDKSQAIGLFIDHGLPRMHLALYQKLVRSCECKWCERGAPLRSPWHTKEELERVVDGAVQVTEWRPTHRTVDSILAEWFGIDRDKLDDEKRAMLVAMSKATKEAHKCN